MREATFLLAAVLFGTASAQEPTTSEPDWAPTGRLSQFRGFATPRPTGIPENAQMMYASVWASWSAWSFCSNGVRMRVRACNTVRGFSCLGPNQETRPCDAILPPSGPNAGKQNNDYDVVDPWEQDRREAMKQLYPDDPAPPGDSADNQNFAQLSRFRPPTPSRLRPLPPASRSLVDHELVGFEERRPMNEADGSPGIDPEKLFGAKQFGAKTLKLDDHKERKHKESEEFNELVPMNEELPNRDGETHLNSASFEDITFDTTTLPPTTKSTTTTTTTTTPTPTTASTTTTEAPTTTTEEFIETTTKFKRRGFSKYSKQAPRIAPRRGFGITDKASKEVALGEAIAEAIAFANTKPAPPKSVEEDKGAEVIDGSFEEAEVIGEHPIRIQPKLPSTAVDDNLEDLLEVAEPEERFETVLPTTTEPPVKISAETEKERRAEITLPLAETDILNSMKITRGRSEMKVIAPWNPKKKKGFGITGFALRKAEKVAKGTRIHDGEVSQLSSAETRTTTTTRSTTTTTTTTTEAPTTTSDVPVEEVTDISLDTLNALDWMLKNMTQAATKEDKEFLNQFVSEIGIPARSDEESQAPLELPVKSFPIQPSVDEVEQIPVVPEKPKKMKKARKTGKKGKKGKKEKKEKKPKLHSGEFAPSTLDKSKMFPKFKARPMKVMRTRALGVRTVSSDKDRVDVTDKEKLMAGVENPEQIYEEIRQLQAEMQQMEKQLSVMNSNEQRELTHTKSLNDPLLRPASSEIRGDAKVLKKNSHETSVMGSDPLRILSSVEQNIETRWSEWSDWGVCFCGKQIRTRNCIFGGNSDGCEGVSHETRDCSGGECPSKSSSAEAPPPTRTGVLEFNPQRIRTSRPHRIQ